MIKKILKPIFLGVFLMITSFIFANLIFNEKNQKFEDRKKYEKEWLEVKKLEEEGLYKSALVLVEKIYKDSKKENNSEQFTKSLIYRLKFQYKIGDTEITDLILDVEENIKDIPHPTVSIVHSLLAELYWNYYENNIYQFNSRTRIENFSDKDLKTWDLPKILEKTIEHYKISLDKENVLQTVDIKNFSEILEKGNREGFRPTLYDFLSNRAIDFFQNTQISLTRPANRFELKEEFYLLDMDEFIREKIKSDDKMSLHFQGVKIFQKLLKFRASKESKWALIDVDIRRLKFAHSHSVHPDKDKLFIAAMKNLINENDAYEVSTEVSYHLANFYKKRGAKYNPKNKETLPYKWDNKNAVEICKKAIENYPESKGGIKCEALISQITSSILSFEIEKVNIPSQKFPFKLNYKNMNKVHWKVIYFRKKVLDRLNSLSLTRKQKYKRIIENGEVVKEKKHLRLKTDNNFHPHSVEILIDKLSTGDYVLVVSNNVKYTFEENIVAFEFFKVSNISYIERQEDNGANNFYVLHRKTGEPLKDIEAQVWSREYNYKEKKFKLTKEKIYKTNKNGYFRIPNEEKNKSVLVEFSKGNDFLMTDNAFSSYGRTYNPEMEKRTTIFTDRSIYRPGQTVYYKGISINTDGEKSEIIIKNKEEVSFYDANGQLITKEEKTTNEYGTFEGSFTIPKGLLNGTMKIQTLNGYIYFKVEEYKRPKFEVDILPFTSTKYRLKDSIEIKAKAVSFAGANLTDAKVKYRVLRKPIWRYWKPYYVSDETEIESGETKTDKFGKINFKFNAKPDLSIEQKNDLSFNYKIIVEVTDLNGETQFATDNILVGYTILKLNIEIPDKINKDIKEKSFEIITKNLNDEKVFSIGNIRIFKLEELEKPLRKRIWDKPDEYLYTKGQWKVWMPNNVFDEEDKIENFKKLKRILTFKFDTEKEDKNKLVLKDLHKWKNGSYVLEMDAIDEFGRQITHTDYFTLFSEKSKELPFNTLDWFTVIKGECEPKEKAKFLIGSKEEIRVLFEIEVKGKIIKSEWLELEDRQKLIEVPVLSSYRGNFSVHFTFVKENRFYSHNHLVKVPYTNKKLDISFVTFRNKLYPGSQEEWQIKIKGKDNEKVAAEMLATLYDVSLDQFTPHNWFFDIYKKYNTRMNWNNFTFKVKNSKLLKENFDKIIYIKPENYDKLNWFGFTFSRYSFMHDLSPNYKYNAIPEESATETKSVMKKKDKKVGQKKDGGQSQSVKLRKNFNETAFFYPNLQTNENGEIIIKFTIPEVLTRWRMLGFSHTKDLKFGFVEKELTTQKELMVSPNAPRFFREGDKIFFSSKISNISKKDFSGKADLELMDAITMKPINDIFVKKGSRNFEIKAGENKEVNWELKIPEDVQAITYKVMAQAGSFSDGEENTIPVLSNRILVTESLPIYANSSETKSFVFNKLKNNSSKTLKNHLLTLEFTSNPVWYAIQSLPYLMEYPYECNEQIFSRYFANSLASHIVNSSPKIKNVFNSWKNTEKSESLLSNLEKNQELKSVLLEETPWVLDAQSESDRKRNIAILFNLNKMSIELNSAFLKLKRQQKSDGSWAWFSGMNSSNYITQYIISGFGKLNKLKVIDIRKDEKIWKMMEKSISYIDNEMKENYEDLKKNIKSNELNKNHISKNDINYLFSRSFYNDLEISDENKEAFDFYKKQAEKYWLKQNKYMQALIALALHRFDEKNETSKKILKSLKETAIYSDEMGMYWKENKAGFYWYQAPVETHATIISAFEEIEKEKETVDKLKTYLLKQKQTTNWKTTKATVEAVYSLLNSGSEWISNTEMAEIKMGDKIIDPSKMEDVKVEAGTGYFKKSWKKDEIKNNMSEVTVKKIGEGISWGSVYWQYFEKLDKITSSATNLKLEKKLFLEKITEKGKILEAITENSNLKLGDKIIVRIVLKSDRNMEYLHLKDMRASGFEPINVISRYKYQDGLSYYESTKDAATNFFISFLPKGTFVFEYPLRVNNKGRFSNGITSIQCMYAPEFNSHSEGINVNVK